nr:hypothetical protein [Paenibacillus brevis]
MRKDRQGIKIPDTRQVLHTDVRRRLLSAANHRHVSHGMLRGFPEQQLHM